MQEPNFVSAALQKALTSSKPIQFVGPLLARITIGAVFVSSGWGKLHNLERVTEFFGDLGIPAPAFNAVFVSYTELVCGALVLFGLATRLAALPLIGTMVVAIITAKLPEVEGLSDLLGTSEFAYLAILTWLVLAGPGRAALDNLKPLRLSINPKTLESTSR